MISRPEADRSGQKRTIKGKIMNKIFKAKHDLCVIAF